MLRRVDFPDPERPTMATHSPRWTTKLTSRSARTGGSEPKVREMFDSSITGDEPSREPHYEDAEGRKYGHWQEMMDAIRDSMNDEEITDLAHQHDYCLYGTPKREN